MKDLQIPNRKKRKNTWSGFSIRISKKYSFLVKYEVQNEAKYFHWVTNCALGELQKAGKIITKSKELGWGGRISLIWHKTNRYFKRKGNALLKLVEEYSSPKLGGHLGLHGETMVLEGFARHQFIMRGRNTNQYNGIQWKTTDHDLDFIFERDGVAYGIEVKNTLGYMDHRELVIKRELCLYLGLRPVFVVRMMPKTWIHELKEAGGFGLILKYQLYPWTHKELANKVARELNLPVDAPKALHEGTMQRFIKWHRKNV